MLCPAAPSMTVPTVAMMRKKKSTARAPAENESSENGSSDDVPHIDAGYVFPQTFIDELLELAGADTSPQSQRDLVNMLQLAQSTYDDERELSSRQKPSLKQIKQFENSIERTLTLLRSIRKYKDWRDVGIVMQPVGRGVVDVATAQEMIRGRALELPRHPSISDQELICPKFDGMLAAINIEPLLRASLIYVRKRRHRRGRPKELGKEAVV